MRRVSLAARRARRYLRRPPRPRWFRPAVYAAAGTLGFVLLGGLGWWAERAGLPEAIARASGARVLDWSQDLGLAVREVYVDGRRRVSTGELRRALGIELGAPILGVDVGAARARLERLTWVDQASVVRLLPDAIHVELVERRPLALWQHGGRVTLIDRKGVPIEGDVAIAPHRHLPVVVGERAPDRVADLFVQLSTEPDLWRRVIAASWIGDRRWTVHLDNRIDVLLPEDGTLEAWRFLARKAREAGLLERAVTVVDLRFVPERLRLRLDPALLEEARPT